VGTCLLFLLVSLLLIEEELHSRLGYSGLHRDRQDGLESRSVLQCWSSSNGVSRGHHIVPSGVEGSRAPPPPSPEMESSSSKESLRVVFKDGDLFGA
jgi:hypothetical protein